MGKRARSEGTIYRDKHDQWWAQLPAGPDGRRPRRKAGSEAEALQLLRQMHAERAAGRDLSRRAETVSDLIADYLETISTQVRPSTQASYKNQLDHVTRRIGKMRLDDVNRETVQRLANAIAKDAGPGHVRSILGRLRAAYARVIPERVSVNPVQWERLVLREARQADRAPLDADQLRRILDVADDLDTRGARVRLAPAWWLAACLGLRRGEIAGLRWIDVNFDRAEVKVRSQVARAADGTNKPGQPTKTPAGVRTLPMGPALVARLRRHWEAQQAERKHRAGRWKEHGMVVAQEDGTPYLTSSLYYDLETIGRRLNIHPIHPHLLRHSFATLVADEGYSEAVIAALLGHERGGSATARYVAAKPRTMRAAVEAVESLLFTDAEARREAL